MPDRRIGEISRRTHSRHRAIFRRAALRSHATGASSERRPEMSVAMRLAPRLLLVFTALCLAGGACVHALAYPKAARIAEHSALPAFFTAAFKGLWLIDSAASLVLAIAFGSVAAFPGTASRSVVVLLALAPLGFAI